MNKKVPACRAAFTLTEVLSVLTILVVLTSLIFAAFSQSLEKAKSVKCVSNLRQLGVFFSQYLSDYQMKFPPTPNANPMLVGGAQGTYSGYTNSPDTRPLNQYANGDYTVYRCPSDSGYSKNPELEQATPFMIGKTRFQIVGTSYIYNVRDMGKGSLTKVRSATNPEMHRWNEIRNPNRLIVMGDMDITSHTPSRVVTYWHGSQSTPHDPSSPVANVLFADWHVKTLTVTEFPSAATFGDNYHFDVENKP